jgi:hypothetical protein
MSPDLVACIDAWIGAPSSYVSRQEAIRQLVTFALEHGCPAPVVDVEEHDRPG